MGSGASKKNTANNNVNNNKNYKTNSSQIQSNNNLIYQQLQQQQYYKQQGMSTSGPYQGTPTTTAHEIEQHNMVSGPSPYQQQPSSGGGTKVPNSNRTQPISNQSPTQPHMAASSPKAQQPQSPTAQPSNYAVGGTASRNAGPAQIVTSMDRRPINPNDRTDIYTAQPKSISVQQQYNNSNPHDNQPVKSQATPSQSNSRQNYQPQQQQQQQYYQDHQPQIRTKTNVAMSNSNENLNHQQQYSNRQHSTNFNTNFTHGGSIHNLNNSQSMNSFRSNDYGPRIAKRELWWKEPERSQPRIPFSQPLRVENVTPRIDDKNPNYIPSRPQYRSIQSRKLEWHAEPITDTWSNIKHQPGGGRVRYPEEQLRWQSTPKVDSGFIYTFE